MAEGGVGFLGDAPGRDAEGAQDEAAEERAASADSAVADDVLHLVILRIVILHVLRTIGNLALDAGDIAPAVVRAIDVVRAVGAEHFTSPGEDFVGILTVHDEAHLPSVLGF